MVSTPEPLPGLELNDIAEYLHLHCPGVLRLGALSASLITGGRSNLTYRVDDGSRAVVLRRPPLGHILPTAHDVERESRVMDALAPTDVPVPEILTICRDPSVIGAPFFVMSLVDGDVYRTAKQVDSLPAAAAAAIGHSVVDTLAVLHSIDVESVGLGDFGRARGFLGRQVRTWAKQLQRSGRELSVDDLTLVEALHARVEALPDADAAVVHGDYRLDNTLVRADLSINAVLDWEMATVGHPHLDLALMLVYRGLARSIPLVVADACAATNYPSASAQLDRYVKHSDVEIVDLGALVSLALLKVAAIICGIATRHAQGLTVGDGFDGLDSCVDHLLRLSHAYLNGADITDLDNLEIGA